MEATKTIGERIREARGKKSQAVVSQKAGVSQGFLSEVERGEKIPSIDSLRTIAIALDVSLSFLLGETEQTQKTIFGSMREETEMSLEEASTFLGIDPEELREIEEGRKAIAPTEKKRLMRAYSHYLAEGNRQGQDLIPIQGGGACGEEGSELSEAMKVLAKDSLIRKSVRMMEDLTEEEKYKVFQYIQDQELVARVKGKKEAQL